MDFLRSITLKDRYSTQGRSRARTSSEARSGHEYSRQGASRSKNFQRQFSIEAMSATLQGWHSNSFSPHRDWHIVNVHYIPALSVAGRPPGHRAAE